MRITTPLPGTLGTRAVIAMVALLSIAVGFLLYSRTSLASRARNETFLAALTDRPVATTSSVKKLSITTRDLIYDPVGQRIYASTPGNAGSTGNSLVPIEPVTGTIETAIPIGSEPGKLAISDNGQYIYVALNGVPAVRRFDTASRMPGLQFSLTGPFGQLFSADDIAVIPGNPNSVAVARMEFGSSPRHRGVAVYDDGVMRPNTAPNDQGSTVIEFSSSPAILYGYNNQTSDFSFRKMAVDASGVTVTSTTQSLMTGFGWDMQYDNGLLYMDNGKIINPETQTQVGVVPVPTTFGGADILPDSSRNRIYVLSYEAVGLILKEYNQTTLVQTGSMVIPGGEGGPQSFIKWGTNGLAFRTTSNHVFILSISDIVPINPTPAPSPAQVAPGIIKLPLASKDLIRDPGSGKVYASLPSAAGTFGNSVVSINADTGIMGTPVYVGSEPHQLAVSDNGQYLYVGLDGAAAVRKVDLASQTAGLLINLGLTQREGLRFTEDLEVLPGDPNAIAISRKNITSIPSFEGIAVYDDGVVRPVATSQFDAAFSIEFSSSSDTLYGSANSVFRKMAVTSNGVSVLSSFQQLLLGSVDIRYDSGRVYSTNGQVINPETGEILGAFVGGGGLVVPDVAAGRVYFLTEQTSSTFTLKAFDSTSFVQVGILTITDVSGTPTSFIKSGPNGLAFGTNNSVYFIATSAITPIPPTPLPSPVQVANGIIQLPLAANDLVYDSNGHKVYASVSGFAGSFGNSVAPIDPQTGVIDTPIFIGSEPGRLAISSDNQFIYAGLLGIPAIRRFSIGSQTAGLQFTMGSDANFGPIYAEDIEVVPGYPHSVAVSRQTASTPHHAGVAVYDDGVMRHTATTSPHTGSNVIEFSATGTTLYGYNNETTEFGLRKLAVTTDGVSIVNEILGVMPFDADIKHDAGVVYSATGRAINPESGVLLGTFAGMSTFAFVPDASVGRIYYVNGSGSSARLYAFNLSNFAQVGTLNIPGVVGSPYSLIRWGANGLAFLTTGNQVYFVQTSLIPPPTNQIKFSATSYQVSEGDLHADVVVSRDNATSPARIGFISGDPAGLAACSVRNGIASARCDYASVVGTLQFAAGESSKTISIPIVDDSYAEGNETFRIELRYPAGGNLGPPASVAVTIIDNDPTDTANSIDFTAFFVRQQYVDFLNREPDPAGFTAWQNLINNCPSGDTTCDRIHVSSAFFRSPEFQERGYFVYRFYPVAFRRKPTYAEFTPDLAKVSGFLSDVELEAAKLEFISEFMNRRSFAQSYDALNNTQYVDTLLSEAGITHPARDFWITALGNGTRTRAQVLREIVESNQVYNKYYNQAFVVMQYFGYLRRDPDALYLDWIAHLDSTGDYRNMINGFMNSLEYRFRFGP